MAFLHTRPSILSKIVLICLLSWASVCPAQTARTSIASAQALFNKGQYSECFDVARRVVVNNQDNAQWQILLISSLIETGRYEQAANEVSSAIMRYPASIALLDLAHKANQYAGHKSTAAEMLRRIYQSTSTITATRRDTTDGIIFGETLLEMGYDPRTVLEQVYNPILKADPNCKRAYIATAELALKKQDYELAATNFRNGLKRFADDADMHCGLARAFYYSDRKEMLKSIDAALAINQNHAPSLLLLAEHLIDCESYEDASKTLDRILKINPSHSQAWSLRSVIANLTNDTKSIAQTRSNALKSWTDNPDVDYIIGHKLSANYRFSEGAAYQRQALKFDPNFIPAKMQLAEDMLRLGQEEQGWKLAEEVYNKDKYNIQAYNLLGLRDQLKKFKSLQAGHFTVRMETRESAVYGQSVLELMQQAESVLCAKYGMKLQNPIVLEIFNNPQDFEVRTFGIPGDNNYMGVCFGNVITANSPKAETPSNWKTMLWHEFAHVVTLGLTQNKMPRWLSEGLSVYEESQRDPSCGRRMDPTYRATILNKDGIVPISKLSSAFLTYQTLAQLQFIYYESSLVVEFLIKNYGIKSIKGILADLKNGMEINKALAENAAPMEKLESEFESFAKELASNLAPGVDWEEPNNLVSIASDPNSLADWITGHPNSLWALTTYAKILMSQGQWEPAEKILTKIIEIYPQNDGKNNPYILLAEVYRNLKQTQNETETLAKLADISSDALPIYNKLMEIYSAQKNWQGVIKNGEKAFAVYPMTEKLHQQLGLANEELGNNKQAIESYQRLVQLDPMDPVDVHYRLARLMTDNNPKEAKKHILTALADAPRFRDGYSLLLKIIEKEGRLAKVKETNEPNEPLSSQEKKL
jgi:tetratricopeptide (TPR) repeat protein